MSERIYPLASIPLAAWPLDLQQRWNGSPVVAGFKKPYRHALARALGRFLAFRDASEQRDSRAPSEAELEDYAATLETFLAGSSVVWHMEHLAYALAVLYPDLDWNELRDGNRARRAKHIRRPVRPKSPGVPRRRRAQLPLHAWPDDLRRRWELSKLVPNRPTARAKRNLEKRLAAEAVAGPDPVGKRPTGRDNVQRGWSRLLFWQKEVGRLSEPLSPALLSDYVDHEDGDGSAPVSVATYVSEIYRGAKAMSPEADWGWLRCDSNDLRNDAEPRRNKAAKLIPIEELCKLGLDLMDEAESFLPTPSAAIQYRDGLVIALLAFRPKRIADISRLVIGASLAFDAKGRPAHLVFNVTKNGDSSDSTVPRLLVDRILRYLDWFRPMLLRGPQDLDYLWLGRDGKPLSTNSFWGIISMLTHAAFGRGIGPHMFRTCYATSVAQSRSELLPAVRAMLDHRDPESIKPYQLFAESINASRALDQQLESICIPPRARKRMRRRKASSGLDQGAAGVAL